MGRLLTLTSILTLAIIGFVGFSTAHAAQFEEEDTVVVAVEEALEDDLFASARSVRIEGDVEGDVYVAAEQVAVNGQIDGSLYAAGSSVVVNGEVTGGVRAAAASLDISGGDIGGGVTFFGSTYSSSSDAQIANGLLFFGDSAVVDGAVGNGVTAFADLVTIRGQVGTDSLIAAQDLQITDTAQIAGDVTYRSEGTVSVAEEAAVSGDIIKEAPPAAWTVDKTALKYLFLAWSFAATVVSGLVLLWLGRRPFHVAATTATSRPLAALGIGILGLLLVAPISTLLFASGVGLPLALLLWIYTGVGLFFGGLVVALAVGRVVLQRLSSRRPRFYFSFLAGVVLLYLLYLIPVVGALVAVLVSTAGFGVILLHSYQAVRTQLR